MKDVREWTALVSGLCSVGKSSFVGALWGDVEMLPAAVRDCTQTNTLIRTPAASELDRRIFLSYLHRGEALRYAADGLAYYRIRDFLREQLGPAAPDHEDHAAEKSVRENLAVLRRICADRPQLLVLNDYLSDAIEELDEFLTFIDSPAFAPGKKVQAKWEDRREHLMGRRAQDGRPLDIGKLQALQHVEIVRSTNRWPNSTPRVLDTPWIPTFHNARRAHLIKAEAQHADVLVILSLPQSFQLEDWAIQTLRDRPELARRTLVVFNQIDTVDTETLFARGGWASVFEENVDRLLKLNLDPGNVFMSCARLPVLCSHAQDEQIRERTARLGKVLQRLNTLSERRPEGLFKTKMLAACDFNDAGIVSVAARMEEIGIRVRP